MRRLLFALGALLVPTAPTAAQEDLRKHAAEVGEALASAGEDVKREADEVASRASRQAGVSKDKLKLRTREAATAIGHFARELAREVAHGAKEGAAVVSEHAAEVYEEGKVVAGEALDKTREEASEALSEVADKLGVRAKDERAPARRARWRRLQARYGFEGEQPSPAISEELRDHDYRVARLERARALARAAEDRRGVARSERLLAAERARHEQRLAQLRPDARARSRR